MFAPDRPGEWHIPVGCALGKRHIDVGSVSDELRSLSESQKEQRRASISMERIGYCDGATGPGLHDNA